MEAAGSAQHDIKQIVGHQGSPWSLPGIALGTTPNYILGNRTQLAKILLCRAEAPAPTPSCRWSCSLSCTPGARNAAWEVRISPAPFYSSMWFTILPGLYRIAIVGYMISAPQLHREANVTCKAADSFSAGLGAGTADGHLRTRWLLPALRSQPTLLPGAVALQLRMPIKHSPTLRPPAPARVSPWVTMLCHS